MTKKKSSDRHVVATNRRALHKFQILERFEAGLMLTGSEAKSVRAGRVNLGDGFARIEKEEAFLHNVHIAPYIHSHWGEKDPRRRRKLLLHKTELKRLMGLTFTKKLAIVPLDIFFSRSGFAKVTLGVAKSKLGPDRREELKRRDVARELRRELGGRHHI